VHVFESADDLGDYAAARVLDCLEEGLDARGVMTLGCPAGRSPRTTFEALGRLLAKRQIDGSRLHLLMMDEYVQPFDAGWRACPEDVHFSCTRYGERHIRCALNAGLESPIPRENLHVPDANRPERYETLIDDLGGIDAFLLAAGDSDGHVAFNPSGTPLEALTRRIELASSTRADNLGTFPGFRNLDEVPRFGVSVGPGTIVRHTRRAILLLTGPAKGRALRRVMDADGYEPSWPATVVHACRTREILADRSAFDAARSGQWNDANGVKQ
jgi:glucosamine-6-phosphate deaminase